MLGVGERVAIVEAALLAERSALVLEKEKAREALQDLRIA